MRIKINFIILIVQIFAALNLGASPMFQVNSEANLRNYIEDSGFNGALLVNKDGRTLLKETFGYKNIELKSEKINLQEKFQIGSVSKQFVAAAILKLKDQGRLSLEDKVTRFLPHLKVYQNIRIRDLLNHTSGIPNYTDVPEFWTSMDPKKQLSLDEIINFTSKCELRFEPTKDWEYSNTGYILAGKIIEVVSGQSWHDFIEQQLLQPLEMKSTGYSSDFVSVSDLYGHLVIDDKLQAFNEFNLSWALSAGALYSNLDDLLKWTEIYKLGTGVLSDESKTEMQTPFLANYALGLVVTGSGPQRLLGHGGRTPGFVTELKHKISSNLSVISLTNDDGQASVANLLQEFYTHGKATALKLKVIQLSENELYEYVGFYKSAHIGFQVFVQNSKLYLQPDDGQPAYLLKPVDKDSFNLKNFAGEEFIRNLQNKVISLKHYQSGQVLELERIDQLNKIPTAIVSERPVVCKIRNTELKTP